MDAWIRLGLQDGIALPASGSLRSFDHVIEIGELGDAARHAGSEHARSGLRAAMGCDDGPSPCAPVESRNLVLADASVGSVEARILAIDSCRHVTRLVLTGRLIVDGWHEAVGSLSAQDVASLAVACSRDGSSHGENVLLVDLLADELRIRLAAGLRFRFPSLALDTRPSSDDISIRECAQRREVLGELEEYGMASRISPADLALLKSEVRRADSALTTVTALQMYKLIASNIELADL